MCCESHLSLSLNPFVKIHPLTTVTNNQMNSLLSTLQPLVNEVQSLSTDLNRKLEGHCLSIANAEKDSEDHFS